MQAVIFDWAGTTINYGSRAPAGVFVEVFAQKGVSVTVEEARIPMGMHKRDHILTMTQMPAVARRWEESLGQPPTEEDVDEMFEAFIPLQIEVLGDYSDLIPGGAARRTRPANERRSASHPGTHRRPRHRDVRARRRVSVMLEWCKSTGRDNLALRRD